MTAPEEFHQFTLKFLDPIQHDYEVIRPIVLFAETVTERSRQTGIARSTVGDTARRFMQQGMLGLVDRRTTPAHRQRQPYPEPVAAHILYLKHIYPPIHYREIVRIIARKFGYTTNHHTVKRFLDDYPIPVQLEFQFTPFHQFEDAYQARWTVIRMYYEGWNPKSIAGCLKLSRSHVYHLLTAFAQDGFTGLEDKRTRPSDHPANQLSLPFLKEVLDIQQEYPRAGRFRVRGLLTAQPGQALPSERTVGRAMALNRQFHGAPGPWSTDQQPEVVDEPKELPYTPTERHQYWFIDLRYLVKLDSGWVYSLCILEGFSRKIVAGMATEYQDLIAVLQILHAALAAYGCPAALVSDNGGVFRAHDYEAILAALHIQPVQIEQGKPWQNLIEAQFKIQLRLADAKFAQAATVDEIQALHAQFIQTFNTTPHWAHRERRAGQQTPEQVLAWIRGRVVEPSELQRVFRSLQWIRVVNGRGFVSVQRFYLYAEPGLARQRVAVWLYDGQVHVNYQHTLLAQYQYAYDRRQKRLQGVAQPIVYRTPYASPQLELFELDDTQWLKVYRRPYQRRPKLAVPTVEQLALLRLATVLLCCHHLLMRSG